MKKRIQQAALAISLLTTVSTLCIKGLKAVDEKIRERVENENKNSYRK